MTTSLSLDLGHIVLDRRRCSPPLDPYFLPPALGLLPNPCANKDTPSRSLQVLLERPNARTSRFDLVFYESSSGKGVGTAEGLAERIVKFLLWSRGGFRLRLAGDTTLRAVAASAWREGDARAFDVRLMSQAYGRVFETVEEQTLDEGLGDGSFPMGGHLDGCRLGFDLGASDFKVAAVREGEVVFSAEFPWTPKEQSDPAYHYDHLNAGLRRAAAHLPCVDAIGGSSAGIYVDNEPRVASLFRGVPPAAFDSHVRGMFHRLAREWHVPLVVINDGEVTALAGAMSLGMTGVLGVAMGSSEAAGFVRRDGLLTDWLNELAFAPVDLQPDAPADEWSADRGVGAQYFSQQAVARLAARAGFSFRDEVPLPERLKKVQEMCAAGHQGAEDIFRTIGVHLGYTIPWYAAFYEMDHVLLLGRVTTGCGGEILLAEAQKVLRAEFPEVAERIALHMPDEKSRRVGQAVAAASLPVIRKPGGA